MRVKELDRPDGEWTEVGEENSQSTTQVYKIYWHKVNGYKCECTGWLASHKHPKTCRHIQRFIFRTKLDNKIANYEARGFLNFQSDGAKSLVIKSILETAKETWGV